MIFALAASVGSGGGSGTRQYKSGGILEVASSPTMLRMPTYSTVQRAVRHQCLLVGMVLLCSVLLVALTGIGIASLVNQGNHNDKLDATRDELNTQLRQMIRRQACWAWPQSLITNATASSTNVCPTGDLPPIAQTRCTDMGGVLLQTEEGCMKCTFYSSSNYVPGLNDDSTDSTSRERSGYSITADTLRDPMYHLCQSYVNATCDYGGVCYLNCGPDRAAEFGGPDGCCCTGGWVFYEAQC